MSVLNSALGSVIEFLLSPFRNLPPLAGLAVVSLFAAIGMLLIVRATSNQVRLAAVKRSIQACIYEVRLFNDDARAMWRAMGEMARHNLTYLRLSLVPLLWMVVPLGLLVAQLQFHYGYEGLQPGGSTLVKARLTTATERRPVLHAPAGVRVETPTVWIPALREAVWRITAEQRGDFDLTIAVDDRALRKTLTVSSGVVRRSPVRPDGRLSNQLLYPAETPLPDEAGVESISIIYPERSIRMLGFDLHWLVAFFGLSMVFAFVLRGPLRVVL